MRRSLMIGSAVAAISLAVTRPSFGGDWPTWRGPQRNGRSDEKARLTGWPKAGPPVVWTAQVGTGCSSATVADGRVFTMGNLADDKGPQDVLFCLDAATGKEVWRFAYPQPLEPSGYAGGPCVTPCVDGDRVYTVNKRRRAFCLDAATGRVIWDTNPDEKIDSTNPKAKVGFGGYAASPLVHGDLLVTGFAALDKATGKTRWAFKHPAQYAGPLPCTLGDKRCVLLFAQGAKTSGLSAVDLADGKELWFFPVSAATAIADPLLDGDRVFLSWRPGADPKRRCAALKVGPGGAEEVWRSDELGSYFHELVLWDGYVYGCDDKKGLRCLDFKTGELKWEERKLTRCQLALADGKLLLQSANALAVADPSPDGYKPLERVAMKAGGAPAPPVLANGRLFCRTTSGEVICFDVSPK